LQIGYPLTKVYCRSSNGRDRLLPMLSCIFLDSTTFTRSSPTATLTIFKSRLKTYFFA